MASVHEIEEGETWRTHRKSAFMRSPDPSADEEEVNLTKTKSVHEIEESPYRHPSKPNMTLLSDEEEEGQVSVHVMMHSDEELRDAISQAMFLEVASENLISKRKRQLELIDKCRSEEIASAKRLFEENIDVYQRTLGPLFHEFSNELTTTLEKASRPIDVPDVTRPPPAFLPMPSMNVPPPPFQPSYNPVCASATPSMNAVTNEMAKTLIAPTPRVPPPLMSQHLLPPPVNQQERSPVSRSDNEKNPSIKHEDTKTHEHEHDSKPIKSLGMHEASRVEDPLFSGLNLGQHMGFSVPRGELRTTQSQFHRPNRFSSLPAFHPHRPFEETQASLGKISSELISALHLLALRIVDLLVSLVSMCGVYSSEIDLVQFQPSKILRTAAMDSDRFLTS
ncbi:Protein CBG12582 [Caenorhabditis briggsae]|uniref:Protein CBG12582 n=1 Tax=Caenorhabditis briggsae TaxID=6238 RepID=A8XG36_CAEBR|nr:Protein CBG12582 [Caenorhabditis briggsae]CAP31541.2 Protein CBG12582 [Caenorhabditis briggsae]